MSEHMKVYVAGVGMITSVGVDAHMTVASVKAGVSGYRSSEYVNMQEQPITMACIPDEVFETMTCSLDEGECYSEQFDRIIKAAILAIQEAVNDQPISEAIPLILGFPDETSQKDYIPLNHLVNNLIIQNTLPLSSDMVHIVPTGRASGIQGLNSAFQCLYQQNNRFVLLGGSESYMSAARLSRLDEKARLLAPNRQDGFVPGEGACFLLLTKHPEFALTSNGCAVAILQPGIGQEAGHYYSERPYHGDGLDQAFKKAFNGYSGKGIDMIYSSMNGEHYWAKEHGVAMMRNKQFIQDTVEIEHPADCLGDLGVATGPVLLGLAVKNLLQHSIAEESLIYSSSDGAWRSAVRIEKLQNPARV